MDDSDLLERLEAKYGKLPQRDSDDEGDDLDPTWTSKPSLISNLQEVSS